MCVCGYSNLIFVNVAVSFKFSISMSELEENSTLNSKVWEAAGVNGNGTFPLDFFSYNNSALLDVIFRHVERTNFSGITVSEGVMFAIILVTVEIHT